MNLAEELVARGLVEHTSATLEKILGEKRTVYIGVDPTADSLHVGHLSWVVLMRRLAEAGHHPVLLVGGGTGMIGDPKEKGERKLLDEKTARKNGEALKGQLVRLLGGAKFRVVNNADWLLKTNLIEFLRDVGKHFTVNDLIKRETIKRRLENPDDSISYTEFTYALLQGFDFYVLHKKYGVDLQMGGSDQWTNLLSGVDLIRKRDGKEAFVITFPLVTDASGKKFGKSEGNAVWLDAKKTSPYGFYQFWLQLPDEKIDSYLKTYSFIALEEIESLMQEHAKNPGARKAQGALAFAMTELVHGKVAAENAKKVSEALFGGNLAHLSKEARAMLLNEAPTLPILKNDLDAGLSVADALTTSSLASSKSDARRLIEAKGVSLAGKPVEAVDQKLMASDFENGLALLKKGKRDIAVLVLK